MWSAATAPRRGDRPARARGSSSSPVRPARGRRSAIRQWVAQTETPVAWLSLDARHTDPEHFLDAVLIALEDLVPGVLEAAFDDDPPTGRPTAPWVGRCSTWPVTPRLHRRPRRPPHHRPQPHHQAARPARRRDRGDEPPPRPQQPVRSAHLAPPLPAGGPAGRAARERPPLPTARGRGVLRPVPRGRRDDRARRAAGRADRGVGGRPAVRRAVPPRARRHRAVRRAVRRQRPPRGRLPARRGAAAPARRAPRVPAHDVGPRAPPRRPVRPRDGTGRRGGAAAPGRVGQPVPRPAGRRA